MWKGINADQKKSDNNDYFNGSPEVELHFWQIDLYSGCQDRGKVMADSIARFFHFLWNRYVIFSQQYWLNVSVLSAQSSLGFFYVCEDGDLEFMY